MQKSEPTDPTDHVRDHDGLFQVVSLLYAAVDDALRLRAALRTLNGHLGGACAQLLLVSASSGRVQELEVVSEANAGGLPHEEWMRRWAQVEFPLALLRPNPAGRVFRSNAGEDSGFAGSQAFRVNFLGATGFAGAVCGIVACDDTTAAVLVQFRATAAPVYDDWASEAFARLLPHVARSCQLRGRLSFCAAAASPSRVLKLLPLPCMLTDEAGRCIERNPALDEVMPALDLKIVAGRARFTDPYLQDSWEAALAEVRMTAVPCALLASSEDGRQWKVHISPIEEVTPSGVVADKPFMLVAMEERSAPATSTAANSLVAASTRNLTPAEHEVLSGLLRGHTAKLIARARGASVNTVRSQIMTILEKTGHHTQKELIASFGTSSFGNSTFDSDGFSLSQTHSAHPVSRGAVSSRR